MDHESADSVSTQVVETAQEPAPQPAPEVQPTVVVETAAPVAEAAFVAPPVDPGLFTPSFEPVAPVEKKRLNVTALIGLILAVPLWPVGLILSTIGLFLAVGRKGGKVLAIIGIVLSILTGGALIGVMAAATTVVSSSTALDPGCASVEGSLTAELASLKSDVESVQSDQDSAAASTTAIEAARNDLSAVEGDLLAASSVAKHDDVRADLVSMNTQVLAVDAALHDIGEHTTNGDGAAAAALTTLQDTDVDLAALCGSY